MITASFDASPARSASACGAYQYDTGQRLRLCGLPSPEELSRLDDFLSGDTVTVQAQYSYHGDSQSESRLALYSEEEGAWLAEVPDAYLARHAPVSVHVYVMYGADAEHSRAKTCYEAAFTPISRPAPSTQVTPDQVNAWDALVAEVNLTLATVHTAASNANAAASLAATARDRASAAAESANAAASAASQEAALWDGAVVRASTLEPGSQATVSVADSGGTRTLSFGIPRGAAGARGATGATGPQGPKGDKGDKGDPGTAGVTFTLSGTTLTITTTA
ncbi:MAG: hypothetical protein J6K32_00300 [Clostridia bacterium]|nr:hypothetical protein [Clostridia bacterium]